MTKREIFQKQLPYRMNIVGVRPIDLAKALNVSPTAVTFWISGKNFPRIDTIQRIADYLGCETDDLLTEQTFTPETMELKQLIHLAQNSKPEAVRAALAVLRSFIDEEE